MMLFLLLSASIPQVESAPVRTPIEAVADSIVDRANDLSIEVQLESPRTTRPWWDVRLNARLVNRSKNRSYRIVEQGYGSDRGLCEPKVWSAEEMDSGDGNWREFENPRTFFCGNHNPDWRSSVITLGPGESTPLNPIAPDFRGAVGARRGRFTVRYAYRARPARARFGGSEIPEAERLGRMAGIEPFEISSPPVELDFLPDEISRNDLRADLALVAKASVPERIGALDTLSVTGMVVNRSRDRRHAFARPGIGGASEGWPTVWPTVAFVDGPDESQEIHSSWLEYSRAPSAAGLPDSVARLEPSESIDLSLCPIRVARNRNGDSTGLVGRMRLRLHYGFGGTSPAAFLSWKHRLPTAEELVEFDGVPSFELESDPIEFEFHRPIELTVDARSALRRDGTGRLTELVELRFTNHSDKDLEIASPSNPGDLTVYLQQGSDRWALDRANVAFRETVVLGARQSLVVGDPRFGEWTNPEFGCRVPESEDVGFLGAEYRRARSVGSIRTEWAELKVR